MRAELTVAAALTCLAWATPAAQAAGPITIGSGSGPADPYPSQLEVIGSSPIVEDVDVRVHDLRHPFADELDIAVVGPGGEGVMLMSDVGSIEGTCRPDLRFSDQATLPVSVDVLPCSGGTYLPTDDDADEFDLDVFPAPAPPGLFGSSLSVFNALDPNGTWSLYVVDDTFDDGGDIASWTLRLETRPPGAVRFSSSSTFPVQELQRAVHLTVRRSGASAEAPLRAGAVTWAAEACPPFPALPDGTIPPALPPAIADQDFSPAQGTLDFAPGETEKALEISLTDDHVPEARECFAVRLASPVGDARLEPPRDLIPVVVSDNDPRASTPSVETGPAQLVLRQKAVIVKARSRADGTLAATGTIALPRTAAAAVRLRPATASVAAGQTAALRLRLSKKAMRAVKRALARRRALTAKVKVTATDLAGGQAARTVRIRLRR